MKFKTTIYVLPILLFATQATAQKLTSPDSINRLPSREFHISILTGFSFLGPGNDMESSMASSGLDDTNPGGWFGDSRAHPYTSKYPIVDVEATYYVWKNAGISLNSGLSNNIEVFGYEAVGIGNFMFLKSELWTVALNYAYSSKDKMHTLFAGPCLFIHHVEDLSAGIKSPDNLNKKPGLYLGYSLRILQKKHWLVNIKANYRAASASEIGPFVAHHDLGIGTPNPDTYTSEFSHTKVNISSMNIGLSLGLRFRKE